MSDLPKVLQESQFPEYQITDATLADATDEEHRQELLEAWEAFHPGEPGPPAGDISDFPQTLEDPPWPSD